MARLVDDGKLVMVLVTEPDSVPVAGIIITADDSVLFPVVFATGGSTITKT